MNDGMPTWRTVSLESIVDRVDYGLTASANDSNVGPKFLRITDIQNRLSAHLDFNFFEFPAWLQPAPVAA